MSLILSPAAGGGGADKLVTDAGSIEGGGGDEADFEALVVMFESKSFSFVIVEGDGSISEVTFVGLAVVEILILVGIEAGVDEITFFNGGAL